MSPLAAMRWLWVAWVLSWLIAAFWSNRTVGRPSLGSEIAYRAITAIGILFLFCPARRLDHKLWVTPSVVSWCLVSITLAGFTFCWWARIHLGRLWSSSVTRKAGHHLVDTGPYTFIRHPIYAGLIIAITDLTVMKATPIAFAGWALTVLGFWFKARLEERFLRNELGPDVYDPYARRTGMFFPGL
jgi:protein-S-isoprenylcysteine O-methyltransferase Ste14